MDIHSGTGKSPITLLNIEKDSLQPLPTKAIRSPYQRYRQLHKVNQSSMITYQSNQYSVPPEYIGKSLLLESDNESLYIYDSIKKRLFYLCSNFFNESSNTFSISFLAEYRLTFNKFSGFKEGLRGLFVS